MRQKRPLASCLPIVKKRNLGTVRQRKQTVPTSHRKKFSPKFKPSLKTQISAKQNLLKQLSTISANNVNSSKNGPQFFVSARIFQNDVEMLLDSGSQINIISAAHCPSAILSQLAKPQIEVNAYNGSPIEIIGCFETDIELDNITIRKSPIYVTRDTYRPILGTPALRKLKIDFQTHQIQQGAQSAKIYKTPNVIAANNFNLQTTPKPTGNSSYTLFSTSEVTINANSEMIIPVKISNDFNDYGVYATEPQSSKYNVLVAKSASHFSQSQRETCIRVCNPFANKLRIEARKPIVNICKVDVAISKPTKLDSVLSDVQIGKTDPPNKAKIMELLIKYQDVFATDNGPLGKTDAVEFDIDTGSAPPVSQQKYKTPYFLRTEMKRIIDKNVQNGLMEACSSPWAAPTLLVKKPNGTWRLVCDYRRLNKITTADQYPLPEIADCVNELSESRIFTTTDLFSGFHQIPTTVAARQKLAVITDFGQYTWLRMPMGAKNCPSVFQRMMDKCFRSMPLSSLVIYLDDILLHSKTMDEHLVQLEELFTLLRHNKLQVRANKTKIATNEVVFCGYRIKDGLKYPNEEKVNAVKLLKTPTTTKGAQAVFGLLNYHRGFIDRFAKKAAPICKTYNAKGRFKWTKEADAALTQLKREICDAALHLKIPNLKTSRLVLETDACDSGYGATLFMCTDKHKHTNHNSTCLRPIEYMSCQFTPAQAKYYIQEKELFAAKEAMRKWAHYLLGHEFDWHIDNACLKWAHRVRSSKLRISQWLAEMSEFNANTILKRSAQMKVSDCLSRQFVELNAIHVNKSQMTNLQQNDDLLANIRKYAADNRWPNQVDTETNFYKILREKLQFGSSGELLLQTEEGFKIAIPKSIQTEIIQTYHDEIGHPGIYKTTSEIATRYIWPTLQADVKDFISTCHHCQVTKPNLKPKQPPLGLSETARAPFTHLAFDLIGPLQITERGNRYALVGTDLFSKRIYAVPLMTKEADQIRSHIEQIVFANPAPPEVILTDNGTEFADITQLCATYNIRHSKSPPYHPQTNGAVERINQTLKQRLFENGEEDSWDERLPRIIHAINCSRNVVTQMTPFELETGIKGKNFSDQIEGEQMQTEDIRQLRKTAMERILDEKHERVQKGKKPNFAPFNIGDLVVAKNHQQKMPRFIGPFEVIKIRGSGLSFELKEIDGFTKMIRPIADLKPYKPRPQPDAPSSTQSDPDAELSVSEPESSVDVLDDDDDFGINFFAPPIPSQPSPPTTQSSSADQTEQTENTLDAGSSNGEDNQSNPDFEIVDNEDSQSDKTNDAESVILSDPDGVEIQSGLSDGFSSIDATTDQEEHLFSDEDIGQLNDTVYESATEQSDEKEDCDITVIQNEEPPERPSTSKAQAPPTVHSPTDLTLRKKSGKVSPRPDVKFEMPLYQLTTKELHDLGNQFNIELSGTVLQKRQQLDEFIQEHFPTQKRTKDGHLLFTCTFDPSVKKGLKEHSLPELKAIIKAYKLPQPSFLKTTKNDIYKHVRKHLLKKYPNSLVNGDIVFSRSRGGSPTSE